MKGYMGGGVKGGIPCLDREDPISHGRCHNIATPRRGKKKKSYVRNGDEFEIRHEGYAVRVNRCVETDEYCQT